MTEKNPHMETDSPTEKLEEPTGYIEELGEPPEAMRLDGWKLRHTELGGTYWYLPRDSSQLNTPPKASPLSRSIIGAMRDIYATLFKDDTEEGPPAYDDVRMR